MGIVQWNCRQSCSYRSNYHSCPYVHTQRGFFAVSWSHAVCCHYTLLSRSGLTRQNCREKLCVSFMGSGMGRCLWLTCIVLLFKAYVFSIFLFRSVSFITSKRCSVGFLFVLVQDRFREQCCLFIALCKLWRCTETAFEFLPVQRKSRLRSAGFLSSPETLGSFWPSNTSILFIIKWKNAFNR